jgi:hypothetical protein
MEDCASRPAAVESDGQAFQMRDAVPSLNERPNQTTTPLLPPAVPETVKGLCDGDWAAAAAPARVIILLKKHAVATRVAP